MELEIIILSKVNQAKKDKYHMIFMWNLKNNTNEFIYKRETYKLREQTYDYQGVRGKSGGSGGI